MTTGSVRDSSATVTVSSDCQVAIPADAMRALGLGPGARLVVVVSDGALQLVPVKSPSELRGAFKGIEPFVREEDDEERVP